MTSKALLILASLSGLCAAAAVPAVSDVTTSQDPLSRRVTVNYTLSDEPGIVTLAAQTNRGDGVWVDVADGNLAFVSGDVNRVVPVGDRSLTWLPHKSWPDRLITDGNIRIGVKAWATNAPPDYMVVSLLTANAVSFYTCAEALPGGVQDPRYKTEYLVMRKCPAGNVAWRMGSPSDELGRQSASETPHEVTLADDYYIGVYPVTQRQYELMTGARPSFHALVDDAATRPVEKVSYRDIRGVEGEGYDWPRNGHAVVANGFLDRLRRHTGLDGFDLPTDAQWEFACRAGCGAALYDGRELEGVDTSAGLGVLARYYRNGGQESSATCTAEHGTAKVGSYAPNAWGLYDMLGNVWEWCLDWYQDSPLGYDVATGPASGGQRMVRGGSWNELSADCRCARRRGLNHWSSFAAVGFRVCCPAKVP